MGKEIENLRNVLEKYGVEVFHSECVISLVRDGLMIVCEETLINGIPKKLENWDKINLLVRDSAYLVVNGLLKNDSVYILSPQFEYIKKQL